MVSSAQLCSHPPSTDNLKTSGGSIDALLRMATDPGPVSYPVSDPDPDLNLAKSTLLEDVC